MYPKFGDLKNFEGSPVTGLIFGNLKVSARKLEKIIAN
jgi:hypothetical protein